MEINYLKPRLPERINRLADLSANLWWSWNLPARQLFQSMDRRSWQASGHNPVKLLHELSSERLDYLAGDSGFLQKYEEVISSFDNMINGTQTWLNSNHPETLKAPVAYFSMEFAVHNSLPIYAGGLGVLAGDTCKEASDLGVPFIGVGFMYPEGYFSQGIHKDGWQVENYRQLDFERAPISRVTGPDGGHLVIRIPLGPKEISFTAWHVHVGRCHLYLLDTNVSENDPSDRELSARLYSAGRELRLQQEFVLGIGGVRLLRFLGIEPGVWHCNEGHTTFSLFELLREYLAKGDNLAVAVERVRAATVFTTHTPVPAGHDVFTRDLVKQYILRLCDELELNPNDLISLGQMNQNDSFNMTVLGLRLAGKINGVSKLHGEVTREMWGDFFKEAKSSSKIPITHITNGVHAKTWVSPEMTQIFERYLGEKWYIQRDIAECRQSVEKIPEKELWQAHQKRKERLFHVIRERVRHEWAGGEETGHRLAALGALLDPDVLTIGFVRRFVEYKRPTLIFRDIDRLKNIIGNSQRPVQIIFAGKSHPEDFMAKDLIRRVYQHAMSNEFQGRLCFVEDYDLHLAHYLVHGVDAWLNNPRRLLEASGTSGMKAAMNGVPNISVRDGWWYEGFNGKNGWAIGELKKPADVSEEDNLDANALYFVLEEMVAPIYYDRDLNDLPGLWLKTMKESISSVLPQFSASRMMKEYVEEMYLPILSTGKH